MVGVRPCVITVVHLVSVGVYDVATTSSHRIVHLGCQGHRDVSSTDCDDRLGRSDSVLDAVDG